jgi:hypothetical protein
VDLFERDDLIPNACFLLPSQHTEPNYITGINYLVNHLVPSTFSAGVTERHADCITMTCIADPLIIRAVVPTPDPTAHRYTVRGTFSRWTSNRYCEGSCHESRTETADDEAHIFK